jgi:ribosomal protein S18 acetylase RimI-like enzyme
MKIRDYQPEDKERLIELTLRAWKPVFEGLEKSMSPDIYEVFVPDWEAQQIQSVNLVCDSEDIDVIVAEKENTVLGFSCTKYHPRDFLGEIYMIGVDPKFQKAGVGKTLIENSINIIKSKGFSLVMVETGGDPGHAPARQAYEAMGFEMWPVARYLKRI